MAVSRGEHCKESRQNYVHASFNLDGFGRSIQK
jgi:hypothetical protein